LNFNLIISPPVLDFRATAPIYQLIINGLQPIYVLNKHLVPIVFIVGLLLQSALFNGVVSRLRLFDSTNHLAAFCYILLFSLFNNHLYLSAPFFANFALLFALITVNSSEKTGLLQSFDAGFIIGIASLCYLPTVSMLLFVLILFNIKYFFSWREFILLFIGLAMPYYLTAVIYFLTNQLPQFQQIYQLNAIVTSIVQPIYRLFELLVKLPLLFLITAVAVFIFQSRYFKSTMIVKNNLTMLIYMLSVSLLLFLFLEKFSLAPLCVPLLSISALLAYAFNEMDKSWTAEIICLSIITATFLFQYFNQFLPL
ncbi:MAG TPA: DUF6427 family protein, partial [Chitinophagales bacterium]|nr:DUF6427 family protein [Chitinophagales bacterium]